MLLSVYGGQSQLPSAARARVGAPEDLSEMATECVPAPIWAPIHVGQSSEFPRVRSLALSPRPRRGRMAGNLEAGVGIEPASTALQAAAVIIRSKRYRTQPPKTAWLRDLHNAAASLAHRFTPCFAILSDEALSKCSASRRGKFVNVRRLGSSSGIPITIRWLAGLAKRQMASVHLKRLSEMGLLKEIVAGCEKLFVNPAFLELLAQ